MSIFCFIHETTTKKLFDFKNVYKYMSHYPTSFDKVSSLFIETSVYTRKSTKTYFQAIMLMNIKAYYLALVSAIQKDWKDEIINLAKTVL